MLTLDEVIDRLQRLRVECPSVGNAFVEATWNFNPHYDRGVVFLFADVPVDVEEVFDRLVPTRSSAARPALPPTGEAREAVSGRTVDTSAPGSR